MFGTRAAGPTWLKGARGLGVLVAVSIGVGACGAGSIRSTAAKADFVARVAVAAASHVASGGSATPPVPAPGQPGAGHTTAPTPAATPATTSSGAGGKAGAAIQPSAGVAASPGTGTKATASTATPKNVPSLAPRTQPSAAQVQQAIETIHNAVPFFTPTPAQVAQVGNEVCTDFDHGETYAEVVAQALNDVGAGSYSWMIPSSVPAEAVSTLVGLYCPGYASKL